METEKKSFYDGRNALIVSAQYGDLGNLHISLYETPVSIQGNGMKKRRLKNKIQALTSQFDQIVAGDVQLDITWFTSEQQRYEYSSFSDLDNIVKVLLDGLSGPSGIYVDDCLVQHFSVTWIDTCEDEHVEITIDYNAVHTFPKEDFAFFHLGRSLCQPVRKSYPSEIFSIILQNFERRNKIIDETGDYFKAMGTMNVQRLFHRNKLVEFEVLECKELIVNK